MSYLSFLALFLVLPIVGLVLAHLLLSKTSKSRLDYRSLLTLGAICLIAFIYTTPWDNYLVYRSVWFYGNERVIGTIGYVPIEEYLFFLLQPILTGLMYLFIKNHLYPSQLPDSGIRGIHRNSGRVLVVLLLVLFAVLGVAALLHPSDHLLYVGLILSWSAPILAGMCWIGFLKVRPYRAAMALGIALPTLYLWVADRTAIALGIWDIADRYSLGWDPLGLPVEEALFFLVTNVLVVVGLEMLLPDIAAKRDEKRLDEKPLSK